MLLAAQRHLRDLSNPAFVWNAYRTRRDGARYRPAEHACQFVELLQHVKGPLAGTPIRLEDWQVFIIASAVAWTLAATGFRRFRRVYIEVPRGNAKSTLSSALALYFLAADGDIGAEVYAVATTKDQAHIVYDAGAAMVRLDKRMRERFEIEVNRNAMSIARTNSKFACLSSDRDTLDGLNVSFACIDELHAHRTRFVYDVMETATGKRPESILWAITTAGSDRTRVCYEVRSFLEKVLQGVVDDEQMFGIIYSIDPDDDWTTEEALRKANPNWGVSVMPDVLAALQQKAKVQASALNNFLTKHLNVWVSADTAWLDVRDWQALADPTLRMEDFRGEPCYMALDLATKLDINAFAMVFVRASIYYAFVRLYLPEERVDNARNSQYAGWARDGHLITTPGNVVDLDLIENEVAQCAQSYQALAVGYDPWQATQMATHLIERGVPMVEVPMTVKNVSEPMKELEAAIVSGRLRHDGNPVLAWMVSNVVCHLDAKDNVYPRKQNADAKIDGVVALIVALGRALSQTDAASVYESRGIVSLGT